MRPLDRERDRRWSRRPIGPEEAARLEELGRQIEGFRRRLGISRVDVAAGAGIGDSHLYRIERGLRRTRASTLRRVVEAVVERADPNDQEVIDIDVTVARLLVVAGDSIAPEPEPRCWCRCHRTETT